MGTLTRPVRVVRRAGLSAVAAAADVEEGAPLSSLSEEDDELEPEAVEALVVAGGRGG